MSLTTKVLLNTVRQKKDGTYPLTIRLTYNRKVTYLPLGYTLLEKDFDAKNQRIKNTSKISDNITRLNNSIQNMVKNVYSVMTKLEEQGKAQSLSMQEIKEHILGKKKNQNGLTVFQFIDETIDELNEANKQGNAAVYKTLRNKLKSFVGHEKLMFPQITYSFLKKMEMAHYAKNNRAGSLSVYMRTLKAVYNRAIKADCVDKDLFPFNDYVIKNGKPLRKAMAEKDFATFVGSSLNNTSLDKAKKLFLASFYMRGINWMDMAYLKRSDIQGDFERISYIRSKTDEPFNIKITPTLRDILLFFMPENCTREDYIFPILRETRGSTSEAETIRNKRKRLNKQLKEIANLLEIEPFTIYAARHTYATIAKRRGVPTAVIQEGLGHSTESMTQTYLDSFENSVVDEYDELIMG